MNMFTYKIMPLSEALNHRYRGITAGKKKKNKYVLVELFR